MATVRITSSRIVKIDRQAARKLADSASTRAVAAAGESYVRTVQAALQAQMNKSSTPMSKINTGKIFKAITRTAVIANHTIVHTGRSIGAKLREFGGVVTPKNRRLLAIPLNMKAYRLQSGTITPNPIDPVPNSLYHSVVPLTFIKTKNGKMFLIAKSSSKQRAGLGGKFTSGEFLFKLQRSAKHRPRPYMAPSVSRGYAAAERAFYTSMQRYMESVK